MRGHFRSRDKDGGHNIWSRATRIGVDLAGLLGGRMASTEGGSVSSGVAYGEGCPPRRELPQRYPTSKMLTAIPLTLLCE